MNTTFANGATVTAITPALRGRGGPLPVRQTRATPAINEPRLSPARRSAQTRTGPRAPSWRRDSWHASDRLGDALAALTDADFVAWPALATGPTEQLAYFGNFRVPRHAQRVRRMCLARSF